MAIGEQNGAKTRAIQPIKAVKESPLGQQCNEVIPEFLSMIPKIRHDAIYRGFGADPDVWDTTMDRDSVVTYDDLAGRAFAITEFAKGFLAEVSLEAEALIKGLTFSEDLLAALAYRAMIPVLDRPRLDLIEEAMSREACRTVASIVYEGL